MQLSLPLQHSIIIMRLQIVLLFVIIAATVVRTQWTKVTFPLRLLQPDLYAISQYYEKFKLLDAYVDWPGSITYSIDLVEQPSKETYVKVFGIFELKKFGFVVTEHKAVYYKNGGFYIKRKTGVMKQISHDTTVTYVPRKIKKTRYSQLSVKYFSLDELTQAIEPFYLQNKDYVDGFLRDYPVTLLATVPKIEGHFVEYTFMGVDTPTTLADGKLRVLLGTEKGKRLVLTDSTEAYRIVFDQGQQKVIVPETFDIRSKPLKNVFGVRMSTKGFLAVKNGEFTRKSVRMLNSDDLSLDHSSETQHSMFIHDLLEKVKTVEPRYFPLLPRSLPNFESRPKSTLFQVHGQVLVKRENFKENFMDPFCPFTIEYAEEGRMFLYGNRLVDKIYTDECKLWVEGEGPVPSLVKKVSLMY